MKNYYLAYGSNLNLKQMNERCPNANPVGIVLLRGFRLVYKGSCDNYAYLTVESQVDSSVPLGLFEVSKHDISNLDIYEGYPAFYSKKYLSVTIEQKKQKALIYIMNDGYDYHLPSNSYVETCIEGYRDFGFDLNILKKAYDDTYQEIHKGKTK